MGKFVFENAFVAISSLEENRYFDSRIRAISKIVDYNVGERPSPEKMQEIIKNYDLVVIGIREHIDMPNGDIRVKVIATLSIATSHINVGLMEKYNVILVNSPSANVVSVAEHTIAFMFNIAKRLREANLAIASGGGREKLSKMPTELLNKNVGIIGFGKIGKKVATLTKGLGMNVFSYTLHPEKYRDYQDVEFLPLVELIKNVDYLTLHIPLTQETNNMINSELLNYAKDGLVLINTSNQDVLENDVLKGFLETGKLGAVALDYDKDCWELSQHPDVYFSPHIAGLTVESSSRIDDELIDNIYLAIKNN